MTTEGSGQALARPLSQPHVRFTLEMALLLLGAELTRGLDLPWRVAGLVFSVLAAVQGIRAIRALSAHRREHRDIQAFGPAGNVLLWFGVVIAVGLTVLQLVLLAATPVVEEQERCRDRALTRTAMEQCDDDLVERLDELTDVIGRG